MTENNPYKLEISLKRVQTFIFEVPRLKAMLGANAMIGEAMRNELTDLVGNRGKSLEWPQHIELEKAKDDPLAMVAEPYRDDPVALYKKGILARDGGHFIAVFSSKTAAENFQKEAEQKLTELLPGVLFEIKIQPFESAAGQEAENRDRRGEEEQLLQLPVLQLCLETGVQPANCEIDKGGKTLPVARSVKQRLDKGKVFYRKETKDIIGQIANSLYAPVKKALEEPSDLNGLKDLAAGDYIALIHADGNDIGKRYKKWRDRQKESEKEAAGEAFFYHMRVAVRRAVVTALEQTFSSDKLQPSKVRPYEVLMLGGDDLLLVCRAEKALLFAKHYTKALHDEKNHLIDGENNTKRRLDVAIGVAIAKHTYPLHRLHELTESLASSAKRLYRALEDNDKDSVIDWQVVTQSWFPDVAAVRRQSERIRYRAMRLDNGGKSVEETLLLTNRPYRVTGENSLEQLLASAEIIKSSDQKDQSEQEKMPRSPLRALRTACEQGRLTAEMAYAHLPPKAQKALTGSNPLWKPSSEQSNTYTTRALDVIDIAEISRLGSQK
ncbi:hypothetical protein SAMN05421690_10736 [Nitrosomonas sp. Nm51]|uniref:Cas10/Cmr2 second palm domain-containing protein n=1 Tax=Nitrosomonas sp. Nm51 TaxID=133720 RepID=UPI0008C87CA6|nr:hypothetical protein [Nitrosomonas sp. Nm51]SER77567.1 hypothetical protein SAMN05421690_10736 [Nitrosomonas sp. Nm51]